MTGTRLQRNPQVRYYYVRSFTKPLDQSASGRCPREPPDSPGGEPGSRAGMAAQLPRSRGGCYACHDTDGQHPRPVRVRRLMIVEYNLLGPNPFRRRRPWPKVPPDVAPQPETPPVLATPTLSDWVGQAAWLLDPVVAEIRQHVFAAEKIHGGHDRSGADAGARPDQNRAAVGLCAR